MRFTSSSPRRRSTRPPTSGPSTRPGRCGHEELEERVRAAYEDFVASGQMSFRARDGAKRLGDAVTWRWEGVSPEGEVLGSGLEFAILAADGRIATDYQFIEG
jgi:hypothetical protein